MANVAEDRPDERVEFFDNAQDRFYGIRVDGEVVGMIVYEMIGDKRILTHTVVEDRHRHRGLGRRMIAGALEDIRDRQLTVENTCPIVDRFIDDHPEYKGIVSA